jgi:iron complex transport system ATP-binding protein
MDRELILAIRDLTVRYPGAVSDALSGVSLDVRAGELHAVLGPNGSGKSTLVRAALGLVRPAAGTVVVLGRAPDAWPRRELARVAAVVAQREDNLFPQRVRETVRLGRYPHLEPLAPLRAADHAAVDRALAACDVTGLAGRWIWTLSGGEYQRVRIARALAQEPRLLVLDEPTASLDVRHEMEVFELARALAGRGLAVIVITHHVNLAARFAGTVLLLAAGRVAGHGTPAAVLTRSIVERVFAWPVAITTFDDVPQVVPLRRHREA